MIKDMIKIIAPAGLAVCLVLCTAGCSLRDKNPPASDAEPQQSGVSQQSGEPEPDTPQPSEAGINPTQADNTSDLYEDILLVYGGEIAPDSQGDASLKSTKMGLYYASDWNSPEELSVGSYFTWYQTMALKEDLSAEQLQEKYASPFGPDTGRFFPQELFEPLVMRYFDVSVDYLRSDPGVYNAEHQGYYIGIGGGVGDVPSIVLQNVEEDGDLRRLHILLDYTDGGSSASENKILTVKLTESGGFQFLGYTSK